MSVLRTGHQSTKISNRMNLLFLSVFLVVVSAFVASSATCIIDNHKDTSRVHVIQLDDSGEKESSETAIIEIHIPSENRKKRETSTKETEKTCKKDEECSPGEKCDLKTSKCRNNKPDKKSTVNPPEKEGKKSKKG